MLINQNIFFEFFLARKEECQTNSLHSFNFISSNKTEAYADYWTLGGGIQKISYIIVSY